MLQIEHLTITHTKDLRVIVSDLNLCLHAGDRAAIIGEEGNGKSTLLKLIYDPDSVQDYVQFEGRVSPGTTHIGYLPQSLAPEEAAMSAAEFWDQGYPADPGQAAKLLKRLGLSREMAGDCRPMATLSGGERVRLRLAKLLALEPELLLLDEPTNDLDLQTLQWLEDFLLNSTVPILFVSHDETLLERTANVIVHLEALRRKNLPRCTVARVGFRDYMESRDRKFLHQAQVSQWEHRAFQEKMDRFLRIRNKVEHQQSTISRQDPHGGQLLKKKMHTLQSMERRFAQEKERLTQMPELEEAIFLRFPETVNVPRGKTVLDLTLPVLETGGKTLSRDIRLKLVGPEKVGIIGDNGCGKTTLLRAISEVMGSRSDLQMAYMPQDYGDILDEELNPVNALNPTGDPARATKIRQYLGSVRFTTREMSHPVGELSGGQKAKLFFLGMILDEAQVLLLDEPTRNFSPLSAPVIRKILAQYGGAIISVSHDRRFLEEVCQTIYALTPEGLRKL